LNNKASLYKVVNYLNNVKFSINNDLLKYLRTEGQYLLDLALLNKPESEFLQINITLKLAEVYSRFKGPFYLNVHSDWRGRLYTHSFFLSYQSSDLNSSLVNFLALGRRR
jgi:hypothetical protein